MYDVTCSSGMSSVDMLEPMSVDACRSRSLRNSTRECACCLAVAAISSSRRTLFFVVCLSTLINVAM